MRVDIWPYQALDKAKGKGATFEVAATITRRIDGARGPGYIFAEDPTPVTLKDGRTVTGQTWWQSGPWNDQAKGYDPYVGVTHDVGTVVGARLNATGEYRNIWGISPLDPNKSDNWPRPPEGYEIRYNEAGQLVITEGGPAAIRQPQQAATGPPAASGGASAPETDPSGTHQVRTGADWQVEPPSFHTWRERGIQKMSALKAAVEWINGPNNQDDMRFVRDLAWRLLNELADDKDASAAAAVYAAADAAVEANAEAAGWG